MITETYESADGEIHWPDTITGSDLDYGIDWGAEWLPNENDTFVSMTWDALPAGLSSAYSNDAADVSLIQISADSTGDYIITGQMKSIESGHEQILSVRMNLKVT